MFLFSSRVHSILYLLWLLNGHFLDLSQRRLFKWTPALTLRSRWGLDFFWLLLEYLYKWGETGLILGFTIWLLSGGKIECFPSRDGSTQPPSSTILDSDGNSDGKCVIVMGVFFWNVYIIPWNTAHNIPSRASMASPIHVPYVATSLGNLEYLESLESSQSLISG